MIIPAQNIIIVVSVLGVLSILGALALFIRHVLKKEHELQEKERATFKQYEEIIKKAHTDAAALLEKASDISKNLASQTKTTNEHLKSDFDKVLQQIADKQIAELNAEANSLKQEYQTKINQMEHTVDQNTNAMLHTAEENLEKELQTFGQTMNSHAVKSEQIIDQKTNEMFQNIEKELAEYKEKKMGRIDTEVLTLIEKTYKEVLGKTLPPDIHRELILDALEKSKKEGLFTG